MGVAKQWKLCEDFHQPAFCTPSAGDSVSSLPFSAQLRVLLGPFPSSISFLPPFCVSKAMSWVLCKYSLVIFLESCRAAEHSFLEHCLDSARFSNQVFNPDPNLAFFRPVILLN